MAYFIYKSWEANKDKVTENKKLVSFEKPFLRRHLEKWLGIGYAEDSSGNVVKLEALALPKPNEQLNLLLLALYDQADQLNAYSYSYAEFLYKIGALDSSSVQLLIREMETLNYVQKGAHFSPMGFK